MKASSALLAICAENSPVTGAFLTQRPVKRSFKVFFDLRFNKRLNKKREAGDLGHYRDRFAVIAMESASHGSALIRSHCNFTDVSEVVNRLNKYIEISAET